MRVRDIIENVNNSLQYNLSAVSFIFGEKAIQNIASDNVTYPCLFLERPLKSRVEDKQYVIRNSNLILFFADKVHYDFNSDEHNVIIDSMDDHAIRFIRQLSKHPNVLKVNNFTTTEVPFGYIDNHVAGVIIEVNIETAIIFTGC